MSTVSKFVWQEGDFVIVKEPVDKIEVTMFLDELLGDDIRKYNDCHDEQGRFCEAGGGGAAAQDKGESKIGTGQSGMLGKAGYKTFKGGKGFVSEGPKGDIVKFDKLGNWQHYTKENRLLAEGPGKESLQQELKQYAKSGKGLGVKEPKETKPVEPIETEPPEKGGNVSFSDWQKTISKAGYSQHVIDPQTVPVSIPAEYKSKINLQISGKSSGPVYVETESGKWWHVGGFSGQVKGQGTGLNELENYFSAKPYWESTAKSPTTSSVWGKEGGIHGKGTVENTYKPEPGKVYEYDDLHLNGEEKQVIKGYTGSGHVEINDFLYGGQKSSFPEVKAELDHKVAVIDAAMERHQTKGELSFYHGTKYRAIGHVDDMKSMTYLAGKTISSTGFRSMSTSVGTSKGFAPYHILFNMNLPKGTNAIKVQSISLHPGEKETLLGRKCSLQISKNYTMSGEYRVYNVNVIPEG